MFWECTHTLCWDHYSSVLVLLTPPPPPPILLHFVTQRIQDVSSFNDVSIRAVIRAIIQAPQREKNANEAINERSVHNSCGREQGGGQVQQHLEAKTNHE